MLTNDHDKDDQSYVQALASSGNNVSAWNSACYSCDYANTLDPSKPELICVECDELFNYVYDWEKIK
jgi:hypothetical protein